jgi:hypothetical protein
MLAQNSQLYVFILVVVLLLIGLLWYLLRNPWKAYAGRITESLLASNPELKKVDWSGISVPDPVNGIMTTNSAYALTSDAGNIGIKVSGKDEKAIKEFIDEAEFYFEPIFEKTPRPLISQLRDLLARDQQRVTKYPGNASSMRSIQATTPADELELEQSEDLFVEFDIRPGKRSEPSDPGKQLQAIAFIIDPRVAQGKSRTYFAKVTAVYDSVSVSEGGVDAILKKDADEIDSGSIGEHETDVMSSRTYESEQKFKLKVTGTDGTNYFRLSGTWNRE